MSFNNSHTLRISVRNNSDDYDFYATRAMVIVDWNLAPVERTVKILPFFEFQMNLDTNGWWRKEAGVEIGTNFFNDYFYYGASFQHIWQQEENYPVELFGETTEWESHFVIILPIKWGLLKDRLKLRLFDEYTYDFARGQFTFNEVGAIFDWQVFEWLRMPIGWRHVDRVSDFDADLLEFSLLFSF